MGTSTQLGQDPFRILLYRDDAAELLLETFPDGLRLPAVTVPANTRVAQEITASIRRSWNLETYCLFATSGDGSSPVSIPCQVLEACHAKAKAPCGMRWLSIDSLSADAFEDPLAFAAIHNSLATLEQYRHGELPGFFAKPGWLRVVTNWVAEQTGKAGVVLTGRFLQFNASPTFSLIRYETNSSPLWFKAVGEPNIHEYHIAIKLATAFPNFVPQVLGSRQDWNAWLSVEAEGVHLESSSRLEEWQTITRALANLQLASFGNGLHLIEAGCKDLRVRTLLDLVDPFFDWMPELMQQQTKPTPGPLSRQEIRSLASAIRLSLKILEGSDIPNVLGHLDLNPGNILVSRERCAFLDWAEAAVGHPFFTFQYLLEHWRRLHGSDPAAEKALVSSYSTNWQCLVSRRDIARDLRVVPLLAAFAFCACGLAWRRPGIASRPESAGYVRSLVRRMKREAETLTERRLVCVP